MKPFLSVLKPLASLKLTVILLALSMLVVFSGSLAQRDMGVWEVQSKYFHSIWVQADFALFTIPLPGGYVLMAGLLINLIAAHAVRFRLRVNHLGLLLLHAGIALLLVGQIATSILAVESQMTIQVGQSVSFTEDVRETELVVIDPSKTVDNEIVIDKQLLTQDNIIRDPRLPFAIHIQRWLPNARVSRTDQPMATHGAAVEIGAGLVPSPPPTGGDVNHPGAVIALLPLDAETQPDPADDATDPSPAGNTADAQPIGTWILSWFLTTQSVTMPDGSEYYIRLRPRRHYKPYTVTLHEFTHERYPGSNIPKHYASDIQFTYPDAGEDRRVLIYMNHPFRFGSETFYQQSHSEDDRTSVLQVVDNPAWTTPYIGCVIVTFGLVYHFILSLARTLRRRKKARNPDADTIRDDKAHPPAGAPTNADPQPRTTPRPARSPSLQLLAPVIALLLVGLLVAYALRPTQPRVDGLNLADLGRLPVLHNGRVKPLDAVARFGLVQLLDKQRLDVEDQHFTALHWYLTTITDPQKADTLKVFRIDHPQVRGLLGFESETQNHFSYDQIRPGAQMLEMVAQQALQIPADQRSTFQVHLLELRNKIMHYERIKGLQDFVPLTFANPTAAAIRPASQTAADTMIVSAAPPPRDGEPREAESDPTPAPTPGPDVDPHAGHDHPPGQPHAQHHRLAEAFSLDRMPPAARAMAGILAAYQDRDVQAFNQNMADYARFVREAEPDTWRRTGVEAVFHSVQPFVLGIVLYVLVFLIAALALLGDWPLVRRTAVWILGFTIIIHTLGIGLRMYIHGMPPVTNLYASAVFVGWGAVVLALVLEWMYRNAFGVLVAGAIGCGTLLVAQQLSAGDDFEAVRAVLATPFWLTTHVLTIAIGYSATFLAGFLAILYIILGIFTRMLTAPRARSLEGMVYGVVCFALLFSFIGTVTGGIWADQSWGRFWGWDPKENGALLIVLITAIILHARWGRMINPRQLMALAVLGNIVTAWSWFGVNLMGVGLHAYGFIASGAAALGAFVATQAALIAVALLPLPLWRSFQGRTPPRTVPVDGGDPLTR